MADESIAEKTSAIPYSGDTNIGLLLDVYHGRISASDILSIESIEKIAQNTQDNNALLRRMKNG